MTTSTATSTPPARPMATGTSDHLAGPAGFPGDTRAVELRA